VRASEDSAVVRLAAEQDVTFDLCPISNVRLQVVPAIAEHPIRRLMEAGVRCTVSTDDPLCFANTLTDEYLALAGELAFTRHDLAQVARNGFEVALLPVPVKRKWIAEIDHLVAAP
jgi:adenosine deaminase